MNKRPGSMIIEVLIAITFIFLINICMLNLFISHIGIYKKESSNALQHFYVNEAFLFIEEKLKAAEQVSLIQNKYGDKMKILKGNLTNYISHENNNLVITYYSYKFLAVNNIMLNINGFYLKRVKNLIYVKIITCTGSEYERCFYLKEKKDMLL